MSVNKHPSAPDYSRRAFLGALAATGASLSAGVIPSAAADKPGPNTKAVCIFSKHLQWLDYKGMGETAAEIGLDGVDITVRPKGHVEPERVADDLPRAVEAVKQAGIAAPMMVTAINDPRNPLTERILKTASALGIRYYRMGYYRYDTSKSIPAYLEEIKPIVKDLAEMNRQYNISASYQNHAGSKNVGATIWDLYELIKDLDVKWIGSQFDIRHATVEGGTCWPLHFRLIAPHINTLVAKDFRWAQSGQNWKAVNCPLGEGMVDFPRYFSMVKKAGISTPVSLHLEYPLGGAERGSRTLGIARTEFIRIVKQDLARLRGWL